MTSLLAPVFIIGEAMVELSGLEGETIHVGVAGDTFNTAVYLARAGVPVTYLTALGEDPFSERIKTRLTEEGIDTGHVLAVPDRNAGLYAISVDEDGERHFTYWRSQSAARSFFDAPGAEAALEALAHAPTIYLSGITLSLFSEEDRTRLFSALEAARERGGQIVFDLNYRPAGWPDPETARAAMEQASRLSSMLLPTHEDEAALSGSTDPEATLTRYRDMGIGEIVVKHGVEGALLSEGGWVRPPEEIKPVDTTGAGDSFNAGYLAARLDGKSPADAAMEGHRLAGAVIGHRGAILPPDHPAWPRR